MTGGFLYVKRRGVTHRAAISGARDARAGINLRPERPGRKTIPSSARRELTSSPRARRAASSAKFSAAVDDHDGVRASHAFTPPKLTSSRERPKGTAGR